jgi:iron complex outermembrane receptor protein
VHWCASAILRWRRISLKGGKISRRGLSAAWIAFLMGLSPGVQASMRARSNGEPAEFGLRVEYGFEQEVHPGAGEKKTGHIEGTVQTADGQTVADVNLTLRLLEVKGETQPLERKAAGSQEGKFSFADLPAGKYTLRAEARGFKLAAKEVTLAPEVASVSVVVTLEILPVNETVVVSETRTNEQLGDLPAHITVLSAEEVSRSTALTLDDFLKRVPSFSLFRRSSGLVAQPTTQGVSLRGVGASGVSRTLVLLDGVPFNDPVGSWVYWSKIPQIQIEKVEVDEGGVSSLYGSSAMAGVIDITTRRPAVPTFDVQGLWGTRGTADLDFFTGDRRGAMTYSVGGSAFRTDGYTLIPERFRGPVDVNATSQHETFNGRIDDQLTPKTMIFLGGRFFNEVRDNGTRLQTNATREGLLQAGLRSHTGDGSNWLVNFFSFDQGFHSSFSSIAANRQSETLTLLQHEPSYGYGGNAQWSHLLPGSQLLAIGGDGRWTYARDFENVFSNTGLNTTNRRIPGKQGLAGAFFQDFWTPWWRLNVIFGVRVDHWQNYDASQTQTVLATNITTLTLFPDVSKTTVTSRAGLVFRATRSLSLRGAFYQGFRAPTIDELYRSFRVGNVVTNANPSLGPEHVNGYEFGLNQQVTPKLFWRATLFADRLDNPVSNVTISNSGGVITQERQNLGYANVKGAEAEANYRLEQRWNMEARYLFNQSVVGSFAANPAIVGNLLPQIPKHRTSVLVSYSHPKWAEAGIEARYESHRFDDSLNQFKLGSYFVLNLGLSRVLSDRWRAFLNLENAFNREYFFQTTPVPQIGTPVLLSGGVRFHWSKDR